MFLILEKLRLYVDVYGENLDEGGSFKSCWCPNFPCANVAFLVKDKVEGDLKLRGCVSSPWSLKVSY